MKRSLSTRVRKISDVVLDVVVSTATNRPRRTRDDSAFDYGSRGRQPHKGGEPKLKRSLSHRNISKDDIRPYSRINPSKSTLDLWVGGGKMKDDVEPSRPHAETSLRSRFSADTEDLVVQTPRGRKAEQKTLVEAAKTRTQRPERPPRPVSEDLFKDLYGERNAVGLAPPAACAVREQLKEEKRRQKMTVAATGIATARPGENVRHRGSTTQVREASAPRLRGTVQHDTDDAVGPPVPPKDYIPPKMKSPFAPLPSQRRLHVPPGAALTRGLSTSSAPDGTAGISKLVPVTARPTTLDERRQPLNMDELHFATTGQVPMPAPRPADSLHRASSWGSATTQTSARPPLYASARPLDGRIRRTARPDENEPRPGRAEYRPYKPSPLRTRQPSVTPLSSQSDAYLLEPLHKRRPSEMDLPRDVFPEDGERARNVRRTPGQAYPIVDPLATVRHMGHKPKPLPPSPAPSTRTIARAQGPRRVKEVPRPIQMTMTIATPSPKRPDSYDLENDVVVIAPLSPTMSMASTRASIRDFHDEDLIERLMARTDDPRTQRQDMFAREQLQFALADEAVRPLSIYQKHTSRQRARQ
ncbi:hypothetical protein V8D89_015256 [Ganoderma adspersum]